MTGVEIRGVVAREAPARVSNAALAAWTGDLKARAGTTALLRAGVLATATGEAAVTDLVAGLDTRTGGAGQASARASNAAQVLCTGDRGAGAGAAALLSSCLLAATTGGAVCGAGLELSAGLSAAVGPAAGALSFEMSARTDAGRCSRSRSTSPLTLAVAGHLEPLLALVGAAGGSIGRAGGCLASNSARAARKPPRSPGAPMGPFGAAVSASGAAGAAADAAGGAPELGKRLPTGEGRAPRPRRPGGGGRSDAMAMTAQGDYSGVFSRVTGARILSLICLRARRTSCNRRFWPIGALIAGLRRIRSSLPPLSPCVSARAPSPSPSPHEPLPFPHGHRRLLAVLAHAPLARRRRQRNQQAWLKLCLNLG